MATVHAPPSDIATAAADVSVGASPVTLTNAGPANAVYTVQGGTVSVIGMKRGATTVTTGLTAGAFFLGVGDQLVITYSGLPTVTKFPV